MPRKKPNKDYWIKRQEDLQNSLLKPAEDYTAEIAKGCREAIREIEKQIAVWYQRFADNNKTDLTAANRMLSGEELKELKWDVWEYIKHGEQNAIDQRWMRELENASARAHISRLEALKLQIRQQAEKLYGGRADKVKELIGDVYRESLYKNGYEDFLRTGEGHTFDRLDEKKLKQIVNKPWTVDGKNFSERIWGNKQKLINELNNELTRGIAMGENPNKTAKALAQKLNSDFNATRRLVMTESAYFATQGQKECYKELDVEEYEILGTLDSTTCERCGSYDGKHFPTKDMQVGVNAPPFHPNCRCTTIPYFDDEFTQNEKRAATDENGNYIEVGNMNYEEWKNKYVVKNNVANGDENGIIKKGLSAHSLDSNGVPKHKKPEKVGNVDFNDTTAVMKVLTDFEKSVVNDTIENACVITKNGEVYRCYGIEYGVYPDADLGDKLYGAIVSHNHPIDETEYTFSCYDIDLFINYGLEILRGVDEKYIYELTRNTDEIDDIINKDIFDITEEEYRHNTVIEIARENQLGYRRYKNE